MLEIDILRNTSFTTQKIGYLEGSNLFQGLEVQMMPRRSAG